MIKAENIIIKDKYKGLKNLVLICDAMDEFAKEYHAEQLRIGSVSQQRELLLAFFDLADELPMGLSHYDREKIVEEFLANNCS